MGDETSEKNQRGEGTAAAKPEQNEKKVSGKGAGDKLKWLIPALIGAAVVVVGAVVLIVVMNQGDSTSNSGVSGNGINLAAIKQAAKDSECTVGSSIPSGWGDPVGGFNATCGDKTTPVLEFKNKDEADRIAKRELEAGYNYPIQNGKFLTFASASNGVPESDNEVTFFQNILNGKGSENKKNQETASTVAGFLAKFGFAESDVVPAGAVKAAMDGENTVKIVVSRAQTVEQQRAWVEAIFARAKTLSEDGNLYGSMYYAPSIDEDDEVTIDQLTFNNFGGMTQFSYAYKGTKVLISMSWNGTSTDAYSMTIAKRQ